MEACGSMSQSHWQRLDTLSIFMLYIGTTLLVCVFVNERHKLNELILLKTYAHKKEIKFILLWDICKIHIFRYWILNNTDEAPQLSCL